MAPVSMVTVQPDGYLQALCLSRSSSVTSLSPENGGRFTSAPQNHSGPERGFGPALFGSDHLYICSEVGSGLQEGVPCQVLTSEPELLHVHAIRAEGNRTDTTAAGSPAWNQRLQPSYSGFVSVHVHMHTHPHTHTLQTRIQQQQLM